MGLDSGDAEPEAWRAGAAKAKSRLGARLFSLGGSQPRAAFMFLLGVALFVPASWIVVLDAARRQRPWAPAVWRDAADSGAAPALPLVLIALFLAAPAGLFFLRLAWRELRGAVVIWHGALELRARGRSRFWPWTQGRAWRRAEAFDLVVAFASAAESQSESVVVTCESRAQREAIVARLIEADVDADPWLDDPRRFG